MNLKMEDAIKRIGRYLRSSNTHPRLVNVNNPEDAAAIFQQFHVGENVFKAVPDFSAPDENISEDALFNYLGGAKGAVFLTGFTSYYKLLGEQKLRDFLNRMIGMSLVDIHLVVVCYQCEKLLSGLDTRYSQFVYLVDDKLEDLPQLVFVASDMPIQVGSASVEGIQNISGYIESNAVLMLYVHTNKHKSSYPSSLYSIKEQNNSFEALCSLDSSTEQLKESYGTETQWDKALDRINRYGSWMQYISDVFGTYTNLEIVAGSWQSFDTYKQWLYFIALKLYGVKNSWCLSKAITGTENSSMLIRGVFRSILSIKSDDKDFWELYAERKNLIKSFGNPDAEVADYCAMVKSKGKYALYYLTDASKMERNLIFKMLFQYADEFDQSEIIAALKNVYPELYFYLQPYQFKNELLNSYFQEYKYQKVINRVLPEFVNAVDEQAERREFNLILPARSEKIDAIPKQGTLLYFMDAMGVEYLSYIMEICRRKHLMAYVTICHCELPSITSLNKEFVEAFVEGGATLVPDKNGIKALDDIKHHGEDEFDFRNNELPTYLSRELEIIGEILDKIATKLMSGDYARAVMISDHGASRLCVISKKENKWEMASKGEHSGRCCLVSDIDEQPPCSTKDNGFWVLANYDRFKGSRPANVEVHGGATLEEVVVPIIEITYSPDEIEVHLLDKKITFSRRKKDAAIKVFSKIKLDNLSVRVSGLNNEYEGTSSDRQTFVVALPDLKKAGTYFVDVYYNNNLLKSGLKFIAENSDFSERKLL